MDGAVNFFGFVLRATFSRTARPIPLRKLRLRSILTAFAALIVAANSAAVWAAAPQVTGINLTSGGVGTVIVVSGTNFGAAPENNTVTMGGDLFFGATLLNIVAASPTELTVVVPPNARTGKIRVTTNDGWGESAGNFIAAPMVNNLSPKRGVPGTTVQIRGRNFSAVTSGNTVTFNGVQATVTAANTIQLTTTVPAGATSGSVSVSANGLTGSSSWPFEILPTTLRLKGFSPGTGIEGAEVTLKGSYFSSNISANQVTIGGISATVTGASSSSMTVLVPNGAVTGPISVSVAGQTVVSTSSFYVAQSGGTLLADGPSIQVSNSAAGQTIDVLFSATAGDNLGLGITSVLQTPEYSSKNPYIYVFKPDGSTLKTVTCRFSCVVDLSSLPVSGTYKLQLFPNATSTLSALVALTRSQDLALSSSAPVNLHMDRVGRISKIRFDGVAGQSRALELLRSSDPLMGIDSRFEIRRSNGSYLYSNGAAIYCVSNCSGAYLLQNLPDTDVYTLVIQQADSWSEDMRVSLVEPTPINVDGPSFSTQANFSYQMGLMTFPATVGQRLELGVIVPITANFITNSFWANWVRVSVFDPLGVRVAEVPLCESLTGSFDSSSYFEAGCAVTIRSAPVAGNYTVVVRDIHPSFPVEEPIQFIATVSTPRQMTTTIDSPPVWLNLNRPGQAGIVAFSGIYGQDLQFNGGAAYNSSVYFPLTAYQPNGSVLLAFPSANSAGAIDLPTLPATGQYSLEENANARKIYDRPLSLPASINTMQSCSQRAAPIPTTITLTSVAPNPVVIGSSARVEVAVNPSNGACGEPQGTVRVSAQSQSAFCIFDLSSDNGCMLDATQSGLSTLNFLYTPADSTMFTSSSSFSTNAMNVVKKTVTAVISSVSPEPSESGQPFTTTVEVIADPPSSPAPTGTVSVSDGNAMSCTISLPSNSCVMTSGPAGPRSISAWYGGDAIYAGFDADTVPHTISLGPPTITSFWPPSGLVGSTVSITGTNFDINIGNDIVAFNGVPAVITFVTATRLVVVVPSAATSGPIQVTVDGRSVQSTSNFTVTEPPPPTITSFSPGTGIYGAPVTIYGSNFNATLANNSVSFNGTPATLTSGTTTQLITNVPSWATTGSIRVNVLGRTATSATNFVVTSQLPAPNVSGFAPMSGVVGIPVTITGQGFNTAANTNNIVKFNGMPAFVMQANATQLVALVPQGVTTGPISVTVSGQTGVSASSFTVVPIGTEAAEVAIASVSAEPSIAGQSFTIQIAVTPVSPSGPTPTGAVTVSDGVHGCLITLPATTCTAMQSEVGETTLFAWYTGDENYASAYSPDFPHITNPTTSTEICGFDPRTVPNDPPGFVPIGQLSGAVYTAGQAQNITGNGSLSVTIDSPEEGSSSPGDIVDVVGTFTGPVNTGITINGIPAKTVNGRFMVPNVRLPKAGTIEAVATTLPGLTATASITLNHSGGKSIVRIDVEGDPKAKIDCLACGHAESLISFHAEQPIGMAPASISFDIELSDSLSGDNLQSLRIDTDGDGVFDHSFATLEDFPSAFRYSRPGLFNALLQVTTNSGQVYTATQWVMIRSAAVERGMLCDVYGYLKKKLDEADANGAGLAYVASVRSRYLAAFTALGANMPSVATQLGTIASGFIGPEYAEILVMRDNADQTRSGYHIQMVQDAYGVWRILGM
ncbi:MAG: IPT/TIG domain-containing protein [Xanthomonadales bacterium]|nr:IPT/TIG domain-containing protein [Xanthomonadales bacterium]